MFIHSCFRKQKLAPRPQLPFSPSSVTPAHHSSTSQIPQTFFSLIGRSCLHQRKENQRPSSHRNPNSASPNLSGRTYSRPGRFLTVHLCYQEKLVALRKEERAIATGLRSGLIEAETLPLPLLKVKRKAYWQFPYNINYARTHKEKAQCIVQRGKDAIHAGFYSQVSADGRQQFQAESASCGPKNHTDLLES